MQEYTTDIHAKRLVKMLQKKNPCVRCPAAPYYDGYRSGTTLWQEEHCPICEKFVGCVKENCPCHKYGEKEAIRRTIAALKKGGYL